MNHKDSPTHHELHKKAVEMEMENIHIEDMLPGEERTAAIERIDRMNDTLDHMEKTSGISTEDIMAEYEKLTQDLAEKSIETVLAELNTLLNAEENARLKEDVRNGKFDHLLHIVKRFFPGRSAVIAACVLMITAASWSNQTASAHAGTPSIQQQHASLHAGIKSETIDASAAIEKAHHLMKEANGEAKSVIENASGFVKALAQKAIVDEIADNSPAIIAYLKNESSTLPQLKNDASKLMHVYKNLVQDVDQIGDSNASREIRDQLIKKIQLVATKDYDQIKKNLV